MATRLTIYELIKESKVAIEGYLGSDVGALSDIAGLRQTLNNKASYLGAITLYAEWLAQETVFVCGDSEHPDFNGECGVYEEVEWEAEFDDAPFIPAPMENIIEFVGNCYPPNELAEVVIREFGRDPYWEMRLNRAIYSVESVPWCMADAWLQLHNAKTKTLNDVFVALEKCFALQHHNGNLLRDHSDIPNIVVRKIRERGLASYIPPQEINELATIYGE